MSMRKEGLKNYSRSLGKLSREIPEAMKDFTALGKGALAEDRSQLKK